MKKGFLVFWGLFVGYFIFVHPCIIYYNTKTNTINTVNGLWALFYLGVSFVLWSIVMGFLLNWILKNGVLAKRNIGWIAQNGKSVQAIIRSSKEIKKYNNGSVLMDLIFEFSNMSGEKIRHKISFVDARPSERRFEVDKTLHIIIDPKLRKNPYFFIEGAQSVVNYKLFVYWILFLAAIVGYYYYAYTTENKGFGWRFLELFHPLLVIPACILFFGGILYFFIRIFVMNKKNAKDEFRLKFWGEKTTEDLVDVHQTGTFINEQPQVKFTLSFTDKKGKTYQVIKKQIVSLMDIGNVSSIKKRDIIYLPENPENFSFWEDINA